MINFHNIETIARKKLPPNIILPNIRVRGWQGRQNGSFYSDWNTRLSQMQKNAAHFKQN